MKSKIFTLSIMIIAFVGLSLKSAKAQYVTIPDANFVAWLQSNVPACMNGNQMDTTCSDITNRTVVIFGSGVNATNCEGIQYFDSLEVFQCTNNSNLNHIPRLPTKLVALRCGNCALPSLPDLPISLKYLECYHNQITTLPLLPDSLISLDCNQNQISVLPILPNGLFELKCYHNLLSNLPSLPYGLDLLDCGYNPITSLPTLPATLYSLICRSNLLTSLPILPDTLYELNCNINLITVLPVLPVGLTRLNCTFNQLTFLPTLPQLYDLNCNNNLLSSLPTLPSSMQFLTCSNNQLTSLPLLPPILSYLTCDNNLLSVLPATPNLLYSLRCSNNLLTSLPPLSNSIKQLYCDNNQITFIAALPNFLNYFHCRNNQLNSLPNIPNTVTQLHVDSNNISCLPTLPNSIIYTNNFSIAGNSITCVPNYIPGMDSTVLAMPLCQDNDVINNPNGCGVPSSISGITYQDANLNCFASGNELGYQNIKLNFYNLFTNQFGSTYSKNDGTYNYPCLSGSYITIIDTLNKPYKVNCMHPGIDSLVVSSAANSFIQNVNFDIICKAGSDLAVQSILTTNGAIFPGQQHTLQTILGDMSQWYGLNCTTNQSGIVEITISGPVTYNGPDSTSLIPTVAGNVFTYNIPDFSIISLSDFKLNFLTDTTAQAGDQICVHVVINADSLDPIQTNNELVFCYTVVNSFDPNYKEVYPTDVLPGYEDWLTYTIHFQNTGTAPAINIRLLDTLDANLNAQTFEVINYSHYNTVTLMDGVLDFRFPNILLPDSTSDLAGSQGFVQYRIKPIANLPLGTQIENTANIYFDYNAPITTNTTENNFITTVGMKENKLIQNITIYPNPSNGIYDLSAQVNIEIYNVVGEKLMQLNNAKTIDLTNEPNGIYFVKMNGITTKKLIKN